MKFLPPVLAIALMSCSSCPVPKKLVAAPSPAPKVEIKTIHEFVRLAPPHGTCEAAPPFPNKETDANLGKYLAILSEAGQDCRSKLEGQ